MQKAIFPMKYINISQNYKQGNHIPYWKGASRGKKAYPIDICGMDSGKDFWYAPCDLKITMIQAKNTSKWTNKMILVSVEKVQTAKLGKKQVYFKVVHFPYSNVAKYGLKVGKVFKQGEIVCTEGKDDFCTGNHIHMECGIGYADESIPNGNGKYVSNSNGKYPQSILYISKSFTKKIINLDGLKFRETK